MRVEAIRLTSIPQIIFTNRIDVCLMAVALTVFWNGAMRLNLPFEYYLMIFFTTLGGYAYNMYTDQSEDNINYNLKYRLFDANYPLTKLFIGLFFFLGFVLAIPAGFWFVMYGGATNLLASLYSTPIKLRFGKQGNDATTFRIKNTPFLKNIYVAFFWSLGLICTPFFYMGKPKEILSLTVMLVILASFGLNYFLEVMWDLRDVAGDKLAKVNTIPIIKGPRFTFILLSIVHCLTCLLMIGGIMFGLLPSCYWIALLHLILGYLFLYIYINTNQKELMSHLYLLYAGVLIMISIFWDKLFNVVI